MEFVILFFLFAIYFCNVYCCVYCADQPGLWKSNNDIITLRQPSVDDLVGEVPREQVDRYVRKAICPAYLYFSRYDEIKASCEENYENWSRQLFTLGIPFAMILFALSRLEFTDKPWLLAVFYAAAFLVCIFGSFLIRKLYRTYRALASFAYSKKDLDAIFERRKEKGEFPICEEMLFNNMVIELHDEFIRSVIVSVRRRNTVKKIMVPIAMGSFFVCLALNGMLMLF